MNWIVQSLLALVLLAPSYIAVGFFQHNFGTRPETMLAFQFLGIALAPVALVAFGALPPDILLPSWKVGGAIMLIGLILGGTANILVYRAVVVAPNPGLPFAIINGAAVLVFVMSALLARWIPSLFNAVKVDLWSLVGIIMATIGIAIVATRR